MVSGDGNWAALRAAIKAERGRRGLSLQEAATAARIARQTWHSVENGPKTTFQGYILSRIEIALGWDVGTVDTILATGSTRTLADVEAEMRAIADNPNRSKPLRQQAVAVLQLIDAVRAANAQEEEATG
ncbi:helix-turn-helix transcriptional regulator [Plantactinospora sp. S1510]|uniref:Helix-turn-helix transcriptional regulator n=1 Tax=Plantactinospora alkalitolerans TaxID=2789879 RepID=A0ABS0HAC9_9ACTN|nr:helix-turn-helix transcriptional regulator [Plantactinospora alkalitolerans]MBF9135375.1 helix-turn-helix transcriptional regulator [Plantactinospora alkalitolerans]